MAEWFRRIFKPRRGHRWGRRTFLGCGAKKVQEGGEEQEMVQTVPAGF